MQSERVPSSSAVSLRYKGKISKSNLLYRRDRVIGGGFSDSENPLYFFVTPFFKDAVNKGGTTSYRP